jgi:DNA (cytosine-5)-methyltransferase 1
MGTGGHNVPLIIRNGKIRKLSPKECLNFQGFPQEYNFPDNIPMSAMYKQAGNSVVVPLIQSVCAEIVKTMDL